MKALAAVGLLTAAAIGLPILAGGSDSTPTTPHTPTTSAVVTTTVVLDVDGLPPRIEYRGDLAHGCDDEGRALDVAPDTEEAWAAAERRCARMHTAIEQAPWPGGMRP
jgi:hypothetical protein